MDVSCEPIAARDMTGYSGQPGVPVMDMGGMIVAGFDRSKIHGNAQSHCQVE